MSAALLNWIERTGNRLPEPATLFAIGTLLVMLLSQIAVVFDWTVAKPTLAPGSGGELATEAIKAQGLLNADGLWWVISHLVQNFINFPPLGIVLVGMLGIGLAERSGLFTALFERVMARVGPRLLTPVTVFVGIMSSLGLDAGYVVLPPLAATLYLAAGRPPLAGIAAVFAGISAGFSANLVITAIDPLLAGFTQAGAQFLDPDYRVAETANWWFMAASTLVLTLLGWLVTARWVEPRLRSYTQEAPTIVRETENAVAQGEANADRGLRNAGIALALALCLVLAMVLIPGAPLHGDGNNFPRWVEATVPLLFVLFFVPGLAYGFGAGTLKSDRDVAAILGQTMASLGPYIVLAFFAAQFIGCFKYSHLGEMLAVSGGGLLTDLQIPATLLIGLFILLVMSGNLLIGSASAKYAFFAPVFVPMFMQVGISPELTQVAYRVGDSITNVITPLNPYMIIVLAQIQHYARGAGLGTIVAMMLPYALAFALVWITMLMVWVATGAPLGPGGGLEYTPAYG